MRRENKKVYPVLFTKIKKGYLIEVPDFEILTEGKDFSDAIKMARDAIGATGITMEDMKKKIPNPSKTINIKKGTFYKRGDTVTSYVDIDFEDYRRSIDNRIVRRNISIPKWLDRKVKELNINVSHFVTETLSKKIACL